MPRSARKADAVSFGEARDAEKPPRPPITHGIEYPPSIATCVSQSNSAERFFGRQPEITENIGVRRTALA
ncbi:MAG: hypothetical protein D6741_07700 [Planctomycetota bacterium]|nr:MAG: hypothetical protein D6741_07700 [Planctomycetota bacterium]